MNIQVLQDISTRDLHVVQLRFHRDTFHMLADQNGTLSKNNVFSSLGSSSSAKSIGVIVGLIIGSLLLISYCCLVQSSGKVKIHIMLNRTFQTAQV